MFTEDTAIRFARQYGVKPKVWNEIWKRALNGYDYESLCGYFLYKTGKKIDPTSLKRWIIKTDIYCRANHIMLMGVRVVNSAYFGEHEDFILKEILRNMKSSTTQDSRIMV